MKRFLRYLHKRKKVWLAAMLFPALAFEFWPISLSPWPSCIMLSWTDDPAQTQTITWQTGQYINSSQIEYVQREASGSPALVSGASEPVDTDQGIVAVHSLKLTNLKPATLYQYRVGNGCFWSPYYTFTTAPAEAAPFSFLLFGDSQGYSFGVWQDTLQKAYKENRRAAFMINIGDLVDMGLSCRQWREWFEAGHGVIEKIAVMAVMGNHEVYNSKWEISQPVLYTGFFHFPDNGPPQLKGKVYSFDYGSAHFTFLDTQIQEEAQWIPKMLSLQEEWLKKDLAATKKQWKLVFMHRPPYHNGLSDSDGDVRDAFAPIFEQYHADVVFAGHDHVYARSYPISKGKWSNEKGTGPVYITTGRSGDRTFAQTESKSWDAVYYNPLDQPNYLTVAVSAQSFTMNVYKLNGEIIDSWYKIKN